MAACTGRKATHRSTLPPPGGIRPGRAGYHRVIKRSELAPGRAGAATTGHSLSLLRISFRRIRTVAVSSAAPRRSRPNFPDPYTTSADASLGFVDRRLHAGDVERSEIARAEPPLCSAARSRNAAALHDPHPP